MNQQFFDARHDSPWGRLEWQIVVVGWISFSIFLQYLCIFSYNFCSDFPNFYFWQKIFTYDLIAFLFSGCLKWPLEAPPALCIGKLLHHRFPSFCCLLSKEWNFFLWLSKTFDLFSSKRLMALTIVETYPEMFTFCGASTIWTVWTTPAIFEPTSWLELENLMVFAY